MTRKRFVKLYMSRTLNALSKSYVDRNMAQALAKTVREAGLSYQEYYQYGVEFESYLKKIVLSEIWKGSIQIDTEAIYQIMDERPTFYRL